MSRRKPRRQQRFPHLLGSKWTSVRPVLGWRHFQVTARQEGQKGLVFAELQAVCDPQVRLWVNAAMLKNSELWQAGWISLQEGARCGGPASNSEDGGPRDPWSALPEDAFI